MTRDDERHGTTRGYAAGCKCDACRAARNDYECKRKKRTALLGVQYRIEPTGTIRRIRALMALGWPAHEIARRCGWTTGEAVLELVRRNWVERGTARAIERVYADLSMTPGPSNVTRSHAVRKGWPPPLSWDDIDTDEAPNLGDGGSISRSADMLAEFEHLTSCGVSNYHAAKQLGVTVEAIAKAIERAGTRAA